MIRGRGRHLDADGQYLGDMTYAAEVTEDGGFRVFDFRGDDGEPLPLGPGETVVLDFVLFPEPE